MIERSDVGCWVLKGSPAVWDYFSAAAEGDGTTHDNWTIFGNHRKDLMQEHDLMVLMITGREQPGIYELGRLTGEPFPVDGMDPRFAVDGKRAAQASWAVPFRATRLTRHVPRDLLREHPSLSMAEPFRAPRMSNPTYFTPEEAHALKEILQDDSEWSAIDW